MPRYNWNIVESGVKHHSHNPPCQWLAEGLWFSPDTPVSFTNKTDRHDITEILIKVALNTIALTLTLSDLWKVCGFLRTPRFPSPIKKSIALKVQILTAHLYLLTKCFKWLHVSSYVHVFIKLLKLEKFYFQICVLYCILPIL